ncbi:MAG: hypothetical protein JXJ20_02990 [Anaerolineae bacterium]|nr:hypothetical protein [Anaerolineae bacterium]
MFEYRRAAGHCQIEQSSYTIPEPVDVLVLTAFGEAKRKRMDSRTLAIAFGVLAGIWIMWQTHTTYTLKHNLSRFSIDLNQRVHHLRRARELTHVIHIAQAQSILGLPPDSKHTITKAELSAYKAELKGLVMVINDAKLRQLTDQLLAYTLPHVHADESAETLEAALTEKSQQVYTRLYELMDAVMR